MTVATVTFEELVQGLDASVPCLIHEILGQGEPCGRKAGRVVFWRNPCPNGGILEPPYATTMCRAHAQEFVRGLDAGIFECEGCGERILSATHSIKRIEDL